MNGQFYSLNIEELCKLYNTDIELGLVLDEVEKRIEKYGYNELPRIKKSLWKIYLAPIFNFLIVILIISGFLVLLLGSAGSTIITFTVVIINSITVIIQQFRAQKALESLRKLAALKATVIRDGIRFEIPTRELVPGDIVVLEQGNKIPADGRIVDAINLTLNEAALTGESETVEKSNEVLPKKKLSIQERKNMVFMGSYITTGRCKIIVVGTGKNTEIGKLSTQLNEMGSIEDIPLTKKLNKLGFILGTIVVINLIILIIYKFSILILESRFYGDHIREALASSIIRSMGVIPINLPLLSTLVLITGVLNMAQQGVIVKNLSAIESLGRVSIICTDKTGTLTKNEMTVEFFWLNGEQYSVTGSGYDEDGIILKNGKPIELDNNPTFLRFIESCVINNNAKLIYEDVRIRTKEFKEKPIRRVLGSPTEAALLVLAEKAGYIIYDLKKKYEIVKEFSFKSELKKMTTVCRNTHDHNELIAFSKGAPERIIEISSHVENDGEILRFDLELKNEVLEKIKEFAIKGYRTLAIAWRELDSNLELKRNNIERELIFLGFVAIMDPPRPEVKRSVKECEEGDINVVMVTGDHPATAKTIAKQLEIYHEGDLVALGSEIKSINKEDFNKVSVFARVEPLDKQLIVERYQEQDKICAMTGDGINDTLALKLANCGIAMGIAGTDVAKEAADMVISDDNFTSIAKGVKIGRGIFAKIRMIIYFFICLNIMEATIFFFYEFVPFFNLFSSEWQHIYIYGIVHSLPSIGLVLDTHPKDVMKEPPKNTEDLLTGKMWMLLLIQAFLMGMGLVLILELTLNGVIPLNNFNLDPNVSYFNPLSTNSELMAQKARTMFITTLYILETNFIWTFRRPNKSLFKSIKEEFNYALLFICWLTLGIHVMHIFFSYPVNNFINDVSGLNLNINFMYLSWSDWLLCILFALPGILGIEIVKFIARKRKIRF